MSTIGDRVLNVSLPKIGEKSLFTRDLEDALRSGGVDFVVHSLKDLPTALPTGMAIGAVLEREDARDALVLRENFKEFTLQTLPPCSVIGTSSLRRTAQLRRQYPHLTICDIRGNLNTRLAKLDAADSKFSGIILAQAGLMRMGWQSRISQVLEPDNLLYAVGQGALAVECRANDNEILDMLRQIMCLPTTCRILAERSFLKTLGGGCSAPVAVVSKLNGHGQLDSEHGKAEMLLKLEGAVWSLNGDTEIREEMACELVVSTTATKRSAGDGNGNTASPIDGPHQKRIRQLSDADVGGNYKSDDGDSPKRRSPPIINDDIKVSGLADTYNFQELIEKHIDLAKKCPIMGHEVQIKQGNGNILTRGGGGDADCVLNLTTTATGERTTAVTASTSANAQHCPLHIDVGQDFMGQCPFVSNQVKVNISSVGKCSITGKDHVDHVEPVAANAEISKCSFAGAQQKSSVELAFSNNNYNYNDSNIGGSYAKCPFLQKTVKMFDYGDEEQPLPKKMNIRIEEVKDLFCGLYQHRCHNPDLYVKSHRLGQQLAENLIKKGALEVMRAAQAEVNSKIS